MTTTTLSDLITCNPDVRFGKPCINGRRIAVEDIAIWHERLGWSADHIASEYDLTLAQVYGALAWYFLHKEEIDDSIWNGERLYTELRAQQPSILDRIADERTPALLR